jgi:hypothetical protein
MAGHSDTENLSLQLPPKYAPGTDLMSKWILNDKLVVNLIVKTIIGMYNACLSRIILIIFSYRRTR